MFLYLLKRRNVTGYDYDHARSMVVAAVEPAQARRLASEECGDEGKAPWLDAKAATLRRIGVAGPGVRAGVVLRDYNEG